MIIIGCDLHTRFQPIAMLDTETGEILERRLEHETGEAQAFYAALPTRARVGIEATGYARWLQRMLAEQGHELWIGDASAIRAARVRQQKTDARDAVHLLHLLVENRFPKIWISSPAERFPNSRKLVSYLGLNPREDSSGGKQRLGSISKQGNSLLRWLLLEAAQTASRKDPAWRRTYQRLVFRRGKAVAKVALARKLAVRLYWQLRHAGAQPTPPTRTQGSSPSPVVGATRPTP